MKKKSMLALALATFMFAGCSDDVKDPDQGGGLDGQAWISLKIAPSTTTKALNTPDYENGTADETNVNEVLVVLFDKDKTIVGSTKDLTYTGAWSSASGKTDASRTTNPFKVPKSTARILVILNPSTKLPPATNGMSYDQYNAAITATVDEVTKGSDDNYDNFMMTNALGDLEPQSENLTTYTTAEEAADNAFALYVDRVVSKVRVYTNTLTSADFALEGEYKWKLNVTNKKFFPVSKRTETALKTATWSDRYSLGSYRIDPNYINEDNKYTVGGDSDANAAYIANYYHFTAEPTWNGVTQGTPGTPQGDTNVKTPAEYCLENTQQEKDNLHAYTTHVIFKAIVVPKAFMDVNNVSIDKDNGAYAKNWFKVGKGYYTVATIEGYILKELKAEKANAENVPYVTNQIIIFLKGVTGEDITYDLTGEVDTPESVTSTLKGKLAAVVAAETSHMVGEVSYYHGGVNYYKIMIKHDNSDADNFVNRLGEFGVVRNSVYDIHINSVKNPGYPVIPEPDPTTPDEEADYYLAVTININAWTWYTQNVEL